MRRSDVGGVPVLANRISYVGELGWELYAPIELGEHLWDVVVGAGRAFGAVPVGMGVLFSSGRLEKGYRACGAELDLDHNLVEAGLARPKVKEADFIGRAAYLRQRSEPPVARLCTLTVDDRASASGVARYMLEPVTSSGPVPVELDGLRRQRRVAQDQVRGLLGKHHHRRVDVPVGDVGEHRRVDHA